MITAKDIHRAYTAIRPRSARRWRSLPKVARGLYVEMARELNRQIKDDIVTVQAVRCSNCNEMLRAEHAEAHACWIEANDV
jgi:ribosomal protein S27AE